MIGRIIHSMLFAAVAAILPVLPAQAELPRTRVEVPEKTFNFGTVAQGTKVAHEFMIKNTGNADLLIQRIAPACGCTAASVDSNVVKGGAVGKIKVEFDTAGFSGSKTKEVQVFTSDLDHNQVTLALQGVILDAATVDPRRLDFGDITPTMSDDQTRKEFKVRVGENSDFTLGTVRAFTKFFSVEKISGGGKEATYRVTVDLGAPKGELRDRIMIELSGSKPTTVHVPVVAFIRGDLRLAPATVSFGVLEPGAILERRVKFENIGSKPVNITGVKSTSPAISVDVRPVKAGYNSVLYVKVDPSKTLGDLRESIEVRTDHPNESTLSLSIFGVQPPR